ncbi:mannosyl-3-phosphoglycerate phosphatase [Chloroflexota bacterium]
MSAVFVFTDLDGTLLNLGDYSYQAALPAVRYLRQQGVPIIFCSSKTGAEQRFYRRELGINAPFIVENGGGIFIPQRYFKQDFPFQRTKNGYRIIELGTAYREIRRVLERIRRETGISFRGWGDMTEAEVAAETGLDPGAARRAKEREYSETLVLNEADEDISRLADEVAKTGLSLIPGSRYHTVTGNSDKGSAVRILAKLFRKERGRVVTIGIGDSRNDAPMLREVAVPLLMQRPGVSWMEMDDVPHLKRVVGVGPEGWSRAMMGTVPELLAKT